ncbi:MAG: hypothetical protein ACR2H5_23860 [Ktedonobacteraceae bacterium]
MATNNPSTTEPEGQTPNGADPQGQTPNPQSQTASGTQQKTSIDTLPVDIQEYIARLRMEAEEANKKTKAEAKAKQVAEEARLAEQGQFKELAAKHEARAQKLEPVAASYAALAEMLSKQITAEMKDWPAEVKALYPGDTAPIEQRLEWLEKSRSLIGMLQQQARGTLPGNRPNPPQAGPGATKQSVDAANRQALLSRRNYGI